jgi:hypothetical protein
MVLFTAILYGCVQSLHPLYTNKTLTFEPKLLGTWSEEKDNDTWTFTQKDSIRYELVYTEKGSASTFSAHLVKLGKYHFLDLYPESPDIKNDFYKFHLLRAHSFLRVWITDSTLQLAILDQAWLKKKITDKKLSIRHEKVDDTIILTAPTRDLQKLVVRYAEDQKAFPNPEVLYRQP